MGGLSACAEPAHLTHLRRIRLRLTSLRLIFSPCLNDLPEKCAMSELFA